jgi:sugar lactone lactonase YvrE
MTSRKRRLVADSDTETGVAKKVAAAITPRDFETLAHDCSLFFSVVPRDIITTLVQVIWRRRGKVSNPAALQFECLALYKSDLPQVATLCFDCNDNLVVPLYDADEVHVYDRKGTLIRKVGTATDHGGPSACVADSRGRLFVTEEETNTVSVFRADNSLERTFGSGQIDWPHGLALSLDENAIYVPTWRPGVVRCYSTDTGEILRDISSPGMYLPQGVAILSDGTIAVSSESGSGTVSMFTATGTLIRSFCAGGLSRPAQIAVDADDNVYVANSRKGNIVVYSCTGRLICCIGCKGSEGGQFDEPTGVAIDSAGRMVVAEWDGARLQLFKSA